MPNTTVHIGNLNSQVTEQELRDYFQSQGKVVNLKLAGDASFPARFAFVEFDDEQTANQVLQKTDLVLRGRTLRLSRAKSAISSKPQPNSSEIPPNVHQQQREHQRQQPPNHLPSMGMHSMYPPPQGDLSHRTIYVNGIDTSIPEKLLLQYFSYCGQITNYKLCGTGENSTRFAFFEYMTQDMANMAVALNGSILGKSALKIAKSKKPIQTSVKIPPLTNEQIEQASRTVHVGSVDVKFKEEDIESFFEKHCGKVARVQLGGDNVNHDTRYCFIEFGDISSADKALSLDGIKMGSYSLKISKSKAPILEGGIKSIATHSPMFKSVLPPMPQVPYPPIPYPYRYDPNMQYSMPPQPPYMYTDTRSNSPYRRKRHNHNYYQNNENQDYTNNYRNDYNNNIKNKRKRDESQSVIEVSQHEESPNKKRVRTQQNNVN